MKTYEVQMERKPYATEPTLLQVAADRYQIQDGCLSFFQKHKRVNKGLIEQTTVDEVLVVCLNKSQWFEMREIYEESK